VNVILKKVSRVGRAVSPQKLSLAVLLSVFVLALITSIVWPYLLAIAVLLVFEPLALVLSSICVVVAAVPMRFVVLPLPVIDISIRVDEAASSVCLIVFPVAFIERAIYPNLDTSAIFAVLVVPLAFVFCAIVKGDQGSLNPSLSVRFHGGLVVEWFK
jgi:hypothetical protein